MSGYLADARRSDSALVQSKPCVKCSNPMSYAVRPSGSRWICRACEGRQNKAKKARKYAEKHGSEAARLHAEKIAAKQDVPLGQKWCEKCSGFKPVGEFYSSKGSPSGYCREHSLEHQKNPRVRSLSHRFRAAITSAKTRAKKRRIPFDLSIGTLNDLWNAQNGMCFYPGAMMTIGVGDTSVSVDRIDSSLGYVHGNVVLCCSYVNTMKNSKNIHGFVEWCRMVTEKQVRAARKD